MIRFASHLCDRGNYGGAANVGHHLVTHGVRPQHLEVAQLQRIVLGKKTRCTRRLSPVISDRSARCKYPDPAAALIETLGTAPSAGGHNGVCHRGAKFSIAHGPQREIVQD